jgi:hypothetical protein
MLLRDAENACDWCDKNHDFGFGDDRVDNDGVAQVLTTFF